MSAKGSALVTGATGYLGSRLALRLAAEGWEVHALVRPTSVLDPLSPGLPALRVHVHDGTLEGARAIVRAARPQVVFHLAALCLMGHRPEQAALLLRDNVVFPALLLEAMALEGAGRLVNTGTFAQHFQEGSAAYHPVNLYAATKQAFEDLLLYYAEATPLAAVTLKLFDTYGPGDPRAKVLSLLHRAACSGERIDTSPGGQLMDLVYIDDVTGAFLSAAALLADGASPGHASYTVASGRRVTLRQLAEIYTAVTGRPIPVNWGGRTYRPRDVMVPWERGTPLPGWSPRVGLEEGIRLSFGCAR